MQVFARGDLQGKVLYWGTSEWSAEQLRTALEIAASMARTVSWIGVSGSGRWQKYRSR